jgi:low affinity Fe/Cu permease
MINTIINLIMFLIIVVLQLIINRQSKCIEKLEQEVRDWRIVK